MKKTLYLITLALVCVLAMMGCKKEKAPSIVGIWETDTYQGQMELNGPQVPMKQMLILYDDNQSLLFERKVALNAGEYPIINGSASPYNWDGEKQLKIGSATHSAKLTKDQLVLDDKLTFTRIGTPDKSEEPALLGRWKDATGDSYYTFKTGNVLHVEWPQNTFDGYWYYDKNAHMLIFGEKGLFSRSYEVSYITADKVSFNDPVYSLIRAD